jgi:hypothetical protein
MFEQQVFKQSLKTKTKQSLQPPFLTATTNSFPPQKLQKPASAVDSASFLQDCDGPKLF